MSTGRRSRWHPLSLAGRAFGSLKALLGPPANLRQERRSPSLGRLLQLEQRRLLSATAVGSNFHINTTALQGAQTSPAVAVNPQGGFVAAWLGQVQGVSGWEVFAQLYNAAGVAQGPQLTVNTSALQGTQTSPAVAVDAQGDFVVTWSGQVQGLSGWEVFAQLYNAAGVAQGAEMVVNSIALQGAQTSPAVAMDAQGDFVVTWSAQVQGVSGWEVLAQYYNAAGAAQGPEFTVNSSALQGTQTSPAVATDAQGDFVITWSGQTQGLPGWQIFAQQYNASGDPQGSQFTVAANQQGPQTSPALAVEGQGNFVVSWSGQTQGLPGWQIFAQQYNASGTAQGSLITVAANQQGPQTSPAVAIDGQGDFVIAWSGQTQGVSGWQVFSQGYNAAGAAQGSELTINTTALQGPQTSPAIATSAGGDVVEAWSAQVQGVSGWNVYGQRLADGGLVVTPTTGLVTTQDGGQASFTVALSTQPLSTVTVSVSSSDPTQGTPSVSTLTFTTANWNQAQTVTVTGQNNDVAGPNQPYSINLTASSSDPSYAGETTSVSLTNQNMDHAGLNVTGSSFLIAEDNYVVRVNSLTGAVIATYYTGVANDGAVIGPDGSLYVGDYYADTILHYSASGTFLSSFGAAELISPQGLFFGPNGNLYVTNTNGTDHGFVAEFSPSGTFIGYFIAPGSGGLSNAKAIVWGPNGNAYVSDYDSSEILEYNGTTGAFIKVFASNAGGPEAIAFGPDGNLYVASYDNDAVYLYNGTTGGASPTTFVSGITDPYGLFFDPAGNLDVSSRSSPNGEVKTYNGSTGALIGNLDTGLTNPAYLASTTSLVTYDTGTSATFSIALNSKPTGDVTITLTSTDPGQGTLSQSSLIFTPANWNVAQTVTVTGLDDPLTSGDQTYQIDGTAASSDPNYDGSTLAPVVVTNMVAEAPGFTVTPTSIDTSMSGSSASFAVALTTAPTATVTVALSSTTSGEGTLSQSSLTFNASDWDVPQTVTVTGKSDFAAGGNVTYQIDGTASSTDANYDHLTMTPVTVTNVDTEQAGFIVTPTSLTTSQAGTSASFTVALTTLPLVTITVNLTDGNPAQGSLSTNTLTFTTLDWNTPQTVTVTGLNDNIADGNQTYQITGIASGLLDLNYNGLAMPPVEVTNIQTDTAGLAVTPDVGLQTTQDGGQASFSVALDSQPLSTVTVSVTSSDPSQGTPSVSSLTFTAADWNQAQTVTVTGQNNNVAGPDQPYSIDLTASSGDANYNGATTSVALTNVSDDQAGISVTPASGLQTTQAGGQASFSVALDSQPLSTVTVSVTSSDPSQGTPSVSSLMFTAADWNQAQSVTVTGQNNNVAGPNQPYSIDLSAASGDANYNGASATVSLTNVNEDQAGISVTPASGLQTTQDGGQASFSVALDSQPLSTVTVSVSSSDPAQGTPSVSSLTFTTADWNQAQNVTVTGQNNGVAGPNQPYSIDLTASSGDGNYNGATASVALTNVNDDPGISATPASGLQTTQDGGQASFSVALDSQPLSTVTVSVSSSDPAQGTPSVSSLTFTAADWNQAQTVTVTGQNDNIAGPNQPYAINLSAASGDSNYNGATASVSLTNVNDDQAGISVTPASGLQTTQDGGQASFSVALTSAPLNPVTISVSSSDPTQGTPSVSSLTFTAANWDQAQTVTVTGQNNNIAGPNEPYTINLTASSADANYDGVTASVSVTNVNEDQASISVTPASGLQTTQDGGQATFNVALTSQPLSTVTISVSSNEPTQGTPSVSSLTFTAANWNQAQTVIVTGQNDNVAGPDQPYSINLTAASSDANYNAATASVSLTNVNEDQAGISATPASGLQTTQDGGQASFSVVLDSQPLSTVTISVTSSDAAQGTPSVSSLTFTAADWNQAQTVTVTGQNNNVAGPNQPYAIDLSAASADANYNGATASVSLTNVNEDQAGPITSSSGLQTTQDGGQATFSVSLSSKPLSTVTVSVVSSDPAQGTPSVSSLTFTTADWDQAQTVTVTGQNNNIAGPNQPYTINLTSSSSDPNYNGLTASVSLININEDHAGISVTPASGLQTTQTGGQASFSVALTSEPLSTVTINVASSDPAQGTPSVSSLTFTAANWDQAQTVTVTGQNNNIAGPNQPYTINLAASSSDANYNDVTASVSVTNVNEDHAGLSVTPTSGLQTTQDGGQASFSVALTSAPLNPVTISVSSSDPTQGTPSVSSLTFTTANWDQAQTVTVTGQNNNIAGPNQPYSINLTASSADANYNGATASVSVTNVNEDQASISVTPASGLQTTQDGGQATFNVALTSQPLSTVTISVSSSDPTQGMPSVSSLTFTAANWDQAQSVTVTGQNDNIAGPNQPYSINLTASSSDANYNGATASVSLTNVNEDQAGISVTPTSGLQTTQAGGQASFSVALDSQPLNTVTISVSSSDPTQGTPSLSSLTFTAADWDQAQTVTVTGQNNNVAGPNQPYSINLTASSGDGNYNGATASVSLTNVNEDHAGITATPALGLQTTQDGGQATFSVALSSEPLSTVTVSVSSSDPTQGTPSVSSLTFTTTDWNQAQTVTVTGQNNNVAGPNQPYSINLKAASGDANYNGASATVSLTNLNEDHAGIIVAPTSGLQTTDAGGTAFFSLVLSSKPAAAVTVFLSSDNPAAGKPSQGSVSFSAANWNVPQTVTVQGGTSGSGDVAYHIVPAAAISIDPAYSGLQAADVAVTNVHVAPPPAPPAVASPPSVTPLAPPAAPSISPVSPATEVAPATKISAESAAGVGVLSNTIGGVVRATLATNLSGMTVLGPAAAQGVVAAAISGSSATVASADTAAATANIGYGTSPQGIFNAAAGTSTTSDGTAKGALPTTTTAAQNVLAKPWFLAGDAAEERGPALLSDTDGLLARDTAADLDLDHRTLAWTSGRSDIYRPPFLLEAEDAALEGTETGWLSSELESIGLTTFLAGAGYVLLNTRAGLWMLSLLTSRPLWKDFDVLEVVYSWEKQEGARERQVQEKETLLSMVDGTAPHNPRA